MWFLSSAAAQVVELPEEDALTSLRLRALGGSITGVAESAAANLANPAAIAVRRSPADEQRVDPDLALQARDHPLLSVVFGTPEVPYRSAYFQVVGNLRVGRLGVGAGWHETRVETGTDGDVGTFLASPGLAYAGAWGVAGVSPQVLGIQADDRGMAAGLGATAGALLAPKGPVRLGASVRTPMRTASLRGPGPAIARLPFEARLGGTWQLGFDNAAGRWGPARVRGDAPVVGFATFDVVFTGGSGDAVVLAEGDDTPERSDPTLSPRLGAEGWFLDDRLRLRGGGGLLAGRGDAPADPYASAGASYRILDDPRGFSWRVVAGGEWYATGPSVGVGLETW